MSCLLDSNIIIFILKGNEKLQMELEQAILSGDVYISTISYYETKRKIILLGSPPKRMQTFENFIRTIKILPFTQPMADIASEIFADLTSRGENVSPCDVLIGATAIEQNLPIVSEDRDFDRIGGIKREKWNRF